MITKPENFEVKVTPSKDKKDYFYFYLKKGDRVIKTTLEKSELRYLIQKSDNAIF